MFQIKLTARPDARMVEVPLDIEVELPREFDGAAVLVSSGMPRKVRLRTPKDQIKLSTAYRIDQLVADLVRLVLRGAQQDVARVQEAAAAYLKTARERRQEGAIFHVESDGRGRVQVVEQVPTMPQSASYRSSAGFTAATQLAGTMADRISAVERSLAALDAKVSAGSPAEASEKLVRSVSEQIERKIDQRLADIEEQLAAAHRGEQLGRPLTRTSQALPTPGASRGGIRRATAVEAFADGLRSELKLRARGLLQSAQERANLCDKAAQIASDAERAGGPKLEASTALSRLASEGAARATALARIAEEIEFYSSADIPLASQLLDRLSRGEPADPIPLLRNVTEEGWLAGTLQLPWLTRAAQIAGWKLIVPSPGDQFEPSLHEPEGPKGEVIDALLAPGVHDKSGTMLLHARVLVRPLQTVTAEDELPALEPEPPIEEMVSAPIFDATNISAPISGPISAPIVEEIISAPILEELPRSVPPPPPMISAPIISAPIISAPIISAPIVSAPIVSAPIISGPIAGEANAAPSAEAQPEAQPISAPIISKPITSDPITSDPIVFDPISGPINVDEVIATPSQDPATEGSSIPSNPPPANAEDEWDRVAKGPSAFVSSEGKSRAEEPPKPETPAQESKPQPT